MASPLPTLSKSCGPLQPLRHPRPWSVQRSSLGCRWSRAGPASPALNSLQGSRTVLLADRLDRSPIQVMAHRILPSTGHEVARTARVSPKRSRQRLRLGPRPQQGQECVPDPNPQRQQGITHLVRQDSRRLRQEGPQGRCMRHIPPSRGNRRMRCARPAGWIRGLFGQGGLERARRKKGRKGRGGSPGVGRERGVVHGVHRVIRSAVEHSQADFVLSIS